MEGIGKHEALGNLFEIPDAVSGAFFHGEVWMKCPHCGQAYEMQSTTPFRIKGRYRIFKCKCGKLFKDY